jgi:hypothetical protein
MWTDLGTNPGLCSERLPKTVIFIQEEAYIKNLQFMGPYLLKQYGREC